jgi:hypothetical protein
VTNRFNKDEIVRTSLKHKHESLNSVEYKYAIISTDDSKSEIVIYECRKQNRSIVFKENREQNRVTHRYDGIMLPPDSGYEKTSFWESMKKTFNKFFKGFGNNDMIKTYRKSIIDGMLYELMNYMESIDEFNFDIEKLTNYFKSVLASLRQIFDCAHFYNSYTRENLETVSYPK